MDRETYTDSRVVDLARRMIPVKMDIDKQAAAKLVTAYRVVAIPTVIFMDARGKVLRQFVGFRSPGKFLQEAQAALKLAKR